MSKVELTKLHVIRFLAANYATVKKEELDPLQCEGKVNEAVSSTPQFNGLDPNEAKKVYAPIIASVISDGIPNTYKNILIESILDHSAKLINDEPTKQKLQNILSAVDPNIPEQLQILAAINHHLENPGSSQEQKVQVLSGALRMIENLPSVNGNANLRQQIEDVQRKLVELAPSKEERVPANANQPEQRTGQNEEDTSIWKKAWKWVRRGIVTVLTILGVKNLFNSESGWARPVIQFLAALGISRVDFEKKAEPNPQAATQPT